MKEPSRQPDRVIHEATVILLPKFFAHESECIICGVKLFDCNKGIAMYEGLPVPHDWEGEWGGFDACDNCFDKHERGELESW